ncbi:hypothetical protein BRADI_1g51383v3 [Brachypodium distachyon]|uniref:Uncharacterized protein n=1 Tax=Brachypodium distachyon TaxID=15368 RepID=A0A2K2DQX2_BRADI|nr:hypothetical protein BRADI_1g51383v3 [Brachypodium distachyon]
MARAGAATKPATMMMGAVLVMLLVAASWSVVDSAGALVNADVVDTSVKAPIDVDVDVADNHIADDALKNLLGKKK